MADTVRLDGLKNLARAVAESDDELDAWLRDGLGAIGEAVAVRVRAKYAPKSAVGAAGVKSKVMKRGNVIVAQSLRRSRNLSARRGSFGGYEMRHSFIPGLAEGNADAELSLETLVRSLEEKWQ